MPSYARRHQLSGSLLYHAINRGNARADIFHCPDDYSHFLKLLKEYSVAFKFKLYHWVIMTNHYHILFEIDEPREISRCMAGLARAYTHYYHRKYETAGYLWQGRFKLQPVQKEQYLIACGRYIERNPVRAGAVLSFIVWAKAMNLLMKARCLTRLAKKISKGDLIIKDFFRILILKKKSLLGE